MRNEIIERTNRRLGYGHIENVRDTITTDEPAPEQVREVSNDHVKSRDDSSITNDYFSDANSPALYKHQQDAVEFFSTKTEIALLWSMGVGKSATILAIAARKFQRQEIDALLIVAPNAVHAQWHKEQLPLWLGVPYESQCLFGRGGQRQAYAFKNDPEVLQVVCVNIDTFSTPTKWRDIVDWANSRKTFIVLDEATSVKSPHSQRTQRMLYEFNDTVRKGKSIVSSRVKSHARAILTGTPVTNGAMDLWSLYEFLRPNFFGRNWYSFQNYYGMFTRMAVNGREINVPLTKDWWETIKKCQTYGEAHAICGCTQDTFNVVHSQAAYEGPYKHADELKWMMEPVSRFMQLKDAVDMPPQTYITRRVPMSDEIKECYDSMVSEMIAQYEGHTMSALNKLSIIIRLQQISSGFLYDKDLLDVVVDDEEEKTRDAGTNYLMRMFGVSSEADVTPEDPVKWIGSTNSKLEALYNDVAESSKPIIIITRFTAEANRIYNDLSDKYSCCLVTGWKRVGTIEEFKEGKYQVMVANIAAISHGFNLQNSCVIAFYSNTYSLERRLQAEGRIFRIGQTQPCVYIDYVYEDTVDEQITASLLLKRNLLDYIRSAKLEDIV
jgi:SNF2 family DNA or RNA helicase